MLKAIQGEMGGVEGVERLVEETAEARAYQAVGSLAVVGLRGIVGVETNRRSAVHILLLSVIIAVCR